MARKKKEGKEESASFFGVWLGEMLARLMRTSPKDLDDAVDDARKKEVEVEQYVEERRQSIRKGARRAGKRFHL